MKTFAEYLKEGVTAREREIVEAFDCDLGEWQASTAPSRRHPLVAMRATPPAKEPASVERDIELADGDLYILVPEDKMPDTWNAGDRVRVVKIEEDGK